MFDLLEYLLRNRGRVVTKDELVASIWNGRVVSDATVASRIKSARAVIDDDGASQRLIRTLLRKGFRFSGAVCAVSKMPRPQVSEIKLKRLQCRFPVALPWPSRRSRI